MTQTKLANEIGVSKRTIIAWENDERQIKPEKAQLLAKHFGVSVGYLLGYDNSPSKIFLKELEEQADHYLTDEEKEELKARPEAKNYYLDLVSWRMRDEQLAQLQQQDKEFDKDFIKFIEKYSIYLSDNQINQIKDLMKSMSFLRGPTERYLTTAALCSTARSESLSFQRYAQDDYSPCFDRQTKCDQNCLCPTLPYRDNNSY